MGRENEGDVAVGARALPIGRLASDLYARHLRRPAVVIGGGPSAPRLLELLRPIHRDMVVISANAHAWRLGLNADYIVCKDNVHTETKQFMEPLLRGYEAPIIARHYWADYRLPQWPIQGNSGQMALGVAALMGCSPIFPIGFDCYQTGTYFHDLTAKNVSRGIRDSQWRTRYQRLAAKLVTADIRLLEPSPLTAAFPLYDPHAAPRDWCIPPVLAPYRTMQTYYGRARHPFPMKHEAGVEVPTGYVFPMDADELAFYTRTDHIDLVDNPI